MSKVLVDRELLDSAASWLEVHAPGGGCVEGAVASDLRELLAQPSAEGVDVVAWRYTSSQAFGRRDRRWHYQETFPEVGARQVQEIGQLEPLVRQSDHLAALSAVTAERDRLRQDLKNAFSEDLKMATLRQQEAEIKQLRADVDALRKDAERYRWLCDQFGITKLPCAIERILAGDVYVADGKAGIDTAIDAAMAAKEA